MKPADAFSLLRPETAESLFVLWRATRDGAYRAWGWQIFRALEMWAKLESPGYTSLESVLELPPRPRDRMESFFLAETLKYLLLLFSDDAVRRRAAAWAAALHVRRVGGAVMLSSRLSGQSR